MPAIQSSLTLLSKKDVNCLYAIDIKGENMLYPTIPLKFDNFILTSVTKQPHMVTQWIEGINRRVGTTGNHRVGFEVEIDLSRKRIGTVQFYAINRYCLVFQLGDINAQNCPPALGQFLSDHNRFTFVGTQVQFKMDVLRRQLSLPRGPFIATNDLSLYSIELCKKKKDLMDLVTLHHRDWARTSYLSYDQVHFASLDALLNIQIADSLHIP